MQLLAGLVIEARKDTSQQTVFIIDFIKGQTFRHIIKIGFEHLCLRCFDKCRLCENIPKSINSVKIGTLYQEGCRHYQKASVEKK